MAWWWIRPYQDSRSLILLSRPFILTSAISNFSPIFSTPLSCLNSINLSIKALSVGSGLSCSRSPPDLPFAKSPPLALFSCLLAFSFGGELSLLLWTFSWTFSLFHLLSPLRSSFSFSFIMCWCAALTSSTPCIASRFQDFWQLLLLLKSTDGMTFTSLLCMLVVTIIDPQASQNILDMSTTL